MFTDGECIPVPTHFARASDFRHGREPKPKFSEVQFDPVNCDSAFISSVSILVHFSCAWFTYKFFFLLQAKFAAGLDNYSSTDGVSRLPF